MKVTGIILAAGNSTRYGKSVNKNLLLLNDIPVFIYTVLRFNDNNKIDDIILVIKENEKEEFEKIVNNYNLKKSIKYVIGGSSRKESVYNALVSTDSDIVIIHDAARPMIKDDYINECIDSMNQYKASTIGVKSKDTIKVTDDNDIVIETTKRSNTWIIQTPQCFDRKLLLASHEKFKDSEVTDDCELMEKNNYKVKLISGNYDNIKITYDHDMKYLEFLLNK
jgi:2-C-methyl-D-erythritol 4-phosphate cytidylyltransferase